LLDQREYDRDEKEEQESDLTDIQIANNRVKKLRLKAFAAY